MINHTPDNSDTRLLKVKNIHHAMVEVTTRCNLRCSYCLVSSPNWVERTIGDGMLTKVLHQLVERNPKVIHLHGHGETTIVEGWTKYANILLDKGVNVSLCSNLMKTYDELEIDVLSKFSHLAVSLDTIDAELFKRLRRGGDIKQVTYNLVRIMSKAKSHNRKLRVSFSVVVCDKNITHLIDLTNYGVQLGISGITLCNLGVIDTPKNALDVKHLSQLSQEECGAAIRILSQVQMICKVNDITCDLKYGIMDSLLNRFTSGGMKQSLPVI